MRKRTGCQGVPASNMLPEVAYVKLGWALGQTRNLDKVKDIMLTPIAVKSPSASLTTAI
jgi:L-asparaginase/Glu-tRNA(Gln) amidotransferase subunit D